MELTRIYAYNRSILVVHSFHLPCELPITYDRPIELIKGSQDYLTLGFESHESCGESYLRPKSLWKQIATKGGSFNFQRHAQLCPGKTPIPSDRSCVELGPQL